MSDLVQRAGTDDGLAPVSLPCAMRVGVLVGWTTAVASLRDPAHRVIGMMWALLTVVAAGSGWVFAGMEGAIVGAVAGLVGYFVVIMVMSMVIEPVLFRRATRVWLVDSHGRRGCAKAMLRDNGVWQLTSVAAWPFERGIGAQLTSAATVDADRSQTVIQLTVENRRVGRLYERFGFRYEHPGRRGMRREPQLSV